MDDELRRMIDAGVDPDFAREFLAIAAGGCLVLRDEGGNVVEREPVSITLRPRLADRRRDRGGIAA
jgi:hypothetical protein